MCCTVADVLFYTFCVVFVKICFGEDQPFLYRSAESCWAYVDANDDLAEHCDDSLRLYNSLLNQGVAAEQARMVLPQNMMTTWYWSGTLGAYCDMLRLRLDPHTQYESRIVAEKVKEIITPLFPVSVPALLEIK